MNSEPGFIIFGTAHIVTLTTIAAICLFIPFIVRQLKVKGWCQRIARIMAPLIVIILLVKTWWLSVAYGLTWERLLPLQICDASVFLCALMLLTRSYRLYEVAYFWAMAGSIAAMLMPDLPHGFPHFSFFVFYLGHSMTVIVVLYATFAFNFRPQLRSAVLATKVTGLYALVILVVNVVLDTNYLYLLYKPNAPSLLDYFGQWPWYVLGLAILTIASFFLCYAPFALARYFRK